MLIEEGDCSVKESVNCALDLLDKRKETLIYITATNERIEKAINCVGKKIVYIKKHELKVKKLKKYGTIRILFKKCNY